MRRLLLTVAGALTAFAAMAGLILVVPAALAVSLAAGVGLIGGLGSLLLGILLSEPSGVRAGLTLLLIGAVAFVAVVLAWDAVFGVVAALRRRLRGRRDEPFTGPAPAPAPLRVTLAARP